MTLSLGMKAQVRSMVFVAGEQIPFFYPMREFIHHNPLHGLEKLSFEEAIVEGQRLFHGRGFLPRAVYQRYLSEGRIDRQRLLDGVETFVRTAPQIGNISLQSWLTTLLTKIAQPVFPAGRVISINDLQALINHQPVEKESALDHTVLLKELEQTLLKDCLFYDVLDQLYGLGIGDELDELMVKSCLNFFDEGQAVWHMPDRQKGFFTAWRELAQRSSALFKRGRKLRGVLRVGEEPEQIIVYVMEQLGVPEEQWMHYFRRELVRLHGWAGFIRWRSSNRHYYFSNQFPGDLVDFLAVRLALALALVREKSSREISASFEELSRFLRDNPSEAYLRKELYGGAVLPVEAQRIESAILGRRKKGLEEVLLSYRLQLRKDRARAVIESLYILADSAGQRNIVSSLSSEELAGLVETIRSFEANEGMLWLDSMESQALQKLSSEIQGISVTREADCKRPFAQALFCIDTRSERLRRHLEAAGDYQTFGVAGFFGVPVSFIELAKGSETHLCPVLMKPKNLVMEMSISDLQDDMALTVLEKVVHELKESVLTPFVTVEAIGLLFGLDMVGKTIAPVSYNKWRSHLHSYKPDTHLLLDKMSREQADSIVRAVQRGVISKAIIYELNVPEEKVNDAVIREIREAALGNIDSAPLMEESLGVTREWSASFIERLRTVYHINKSDARLQMERLGRIGFSLDEQVGFVSQTLRSIGLTKNFSRFVVIAGHGSQSENNPYESALDCGACGGNQGIYNARIFASMANKQSVRHRLKKQGIDIPDDTWFVPAYHNTTSDHVHLHDLELLPSSHLIYLDRLQNGLSAASRQCAQERLPTLDEKYDGLDASESSRRILRNAMDWSQVRPEWGLSRNAYFIIGRRALTEALTLEGRAFLHSYDYRIDGKLRLLENILSGPLVVGQWINMEHYFSTVDNERYGSGSKVYHNVAGRFGVMTGNLSDLRTGLPAQTVLKNGMPYHEPMRLMTVIEAPLAHVNAIIGRVSVVRRLLNNGWIRLMVFDPETGDFHIHTHGQWNNSPEPKHPGHDNEPEAMAR